MKIEKMVQFEECVEINVGVEDLRSLYSSGEEGTEFYASSVINDFYKVLCSVDDEIISKMSFNKKDVICKALLEQAERFRVE